MASTSTHLALSKQVDQLQRELKVERVKISQVCADLAAYCNQRADDDFLLTKQLQPGHTNPYKEKRGLCTVL